MRGKRKRSGASVTPRPGPSSVRLTGNKLVITEPEMIRLIQESYAKIPKHNSPKRMTLNEFVILALTLGLRKFEGRLKR